MKQIAIEYFGDQFELADQYHNFLATAGIERGLIGPREAEKLWERHILNCAVIHSLIPENATVADIGSGAGLPGLVLAIIRPDLRITLIEPLLRRTTFLTEAVVELGLSNVEVVRGKADTCHHRKFDVVTSRAVAPLAKLLAWSLPMVAKNGHVHAIKGSSATAEIAGLPVITKKQLVLSTTILGDTLLSTPTVVVSAQSK